MPADRSQSFENHRKLNWFAISLSFAALLALILAGTNIALQSAALEAVIVFLIALVLLLQFLNERWNDLTLQDRLIRLEMRVRLHRVLPADLHPRLSDLTMGQVIALRFASDEEMESLVRRVLEGDLKEPKAIKRAVKDWQADFQRV